MKRLLTILGICALGFHPGAAQSLTPETALAAFRRAQTLARKDGGALWGRSLEGPILLVELGTLRVMANRPDAEGRLQARDGVYTATLPAGTPVANTASTWAGVRWTMLFWDGLEGLPPADLDSLLMHESWHRIQDGLGLSHPSEPCAHLDAEQGRVWLRLELRALAKALGSKGQVRKQALRDALAFRAERYRRFPEARGAEAALEMNEGLAQYTGLRLAFAGNAAAERAAKDAAAADRNPRYSRSFAYATGPAYGLLLDAYAPGWRARVPKVLSFPRLLPAAWGKGDAEGAAAAYGATEVRGQEHTAALARAARGEALRKRFQADPVLALSGPLNITFNPSNLETVEGLGTHYPDLKAQGPWGHVEVTGGGLLSADWNTLTLPAPEDAGARPVKAFGYRLYLEEGWELAPGKREGDWVVRKRDGSGTAAPEGKPRG
jgi:hypothetical protein